MQTVAEIIGGTFWLALTGYNIYKYKINQKNTQRFDGIPKITNAKELKEYRAGDRVILQNIIPTPINSQDVYFQWSIFQKNIEQKLPKFWQYEPNPRGVQYSKFFFKQDPKNRQVQVSVGYENTKFHDNALRKSSATSSYLYKKYQPIYIIGVVGCVGSIGVDFNGLKYEIVAEIVGKNVRELVEAFEKAKDQAVLSLVGLGIVLVAYFVIRPKKKRGNH